MFQEYRVSIRKWKESGNLSASAHVSWQGTLLCPRKGIDHSIKVD